MPHDEARTLSDVTNARRDSRTFIPICHIWPKLLEHTAGAPHRPSLLAAGQSHSPFDFSRLRTAHRVRYSCKAVDRKCEANDSTAPLRLGSRASKSRIRRGAVVRARNYSRHGHGHERLPEGDRQRLEVQRAAEAAMVLSGRASALSPCARTHSSPLRLLRLTVYPYTLVSSPPPASRSVPVHTRPFHPFRLLHAAGTSMRVVS